MPLKWTNRSRPPSSGVMNPNPLSSLNHFTVPVAMCLPFGLLVLKSGCPPGPDPTPENLAGSPTGEGRVARTVGEERVHGGAQVAGVEERSGNRRHSLVGPLHPAVEVLADHLPRRRMSQRRPVGQ